MAHPLHLLVGHKIAVSTSGARERPPEDEKRETSPDRRDDKSVDLGISAPPESIR
jgi:hypothetical protein